MIRRLAKARVALALALALYLAPAILAWVDPWSALARPEPRGQAGPTSRAHQARCQRARGPRHHRRRSCRRGSKRTDPHRAPRSRPAAAGVARSRSTPTPSWIGDFGADDWSQYDGSPAYHPDGNPADFAVVRAPAPSRYRFAFQATVEADGTSVLADEAGDRTLLTLWPGSGDGRAGKSHAYQGADTWYRDAIYFPASFHPTANTSWNWLYELHDFPNTACCANFALSVDTDGQDGGAAGGARLSVRIMGGGSPQDPIDGGQRSAYFNPAATVRWILGPSLQYNRWYDLVWHVHWDWRPRAQGGRGLLEYYVNGTRVGVYQGPTLFYYADTGIGSPGPGQAYLQDGFYRPTDAGAGYAQPTVRVYHAATAIGASAAAIGENLSH